MPTVFKNLTWLSALNLDTTPDGQTDFALIRATI
jgi:hypothetical protein